MTSSDRRRDLAEDTPDRDDTPGDAPHRDDSVDPTTAQCTSPTAPPGDPLAGIDPRFVVPDWQPRDVGALTPGTTLSTYAEVERGDRGPDPVPAWVITARDALDTDLGVLKTGKEADVRLVLRSAEDGTGTETVMARKTYRDDGHRSFHRSAQYTEGRRTRRSRDARALERKSRYGRAVASGQWARAEWQTLVLAWSAGLPVPYPVQIDGTSLFLELITGPDGDPAPRLVAWRPPPGCDRADADALLGAWWQQVCDIVCGFASLGLVHGDLSPYNLLTAGERIVVIDLPQAIDLAANPAAVEFLARDCRTLAAWFTARGLTVDADEVLAEALAHAW